METTRSIRKALSPGNWVTSIDLKDAYFHITVHPDYRKYFRIVVGGKFLEFKALSFRLSPTTRGFVGSQEFWASCSTTHHLSSSVFGSLAPQSHVKSHLSGTHPVSTKKTQALGFLVNWAKSELVPTQRFIFCRQAYNLIAGLVRPSEEAVAKVLVIWRILCRQPLQRARFLLQLLGVLNSVTDIPGDLFSSSSSPSGPWHHNCCVS